MLEYGVYGPLTEDQQGAVKMIFDSSQQMTRIVNDLLQQSRLERGTFRLDISEFVLSDLLERLSKSSRAFSKGERIGIQSRAFTRHAKNYPG